MTQNMNLKELERKAFTSYHGDGILDIFAGAWIFVFGMLGIYSDKVWAAGMFPVWGLPVWAAMKKRITVPRIGYVKFGHKRISKIQKVFFFLHFLVYACAVVVILMADAHNTPAWVETLLTDYPVLVFGISVTLLFFVCVWTLNIRHFFIYGIVTLLVSVGGHLFTSVPWGYFPVVLGIIIMGAGVGLFTQFLRTYPVTAKTVRNDSNAEGCT